MPRRVNFDPINWAESSESVAGHWQPKNEWCSSDEWPPRLGQKTSDYQCCCEVDLWMILIHHSKKTQMALKKNAGMCVGKYSNEGALLADWYYSLAWRFISFEIPTNVLFQSYFVYCYLAGGISSVQLAGRLLGSHPWVHAGFPGRFNRIPHSTSVHSGKNQPYYAHLKEWKV